MDSRHHVRSRSVSNLVSDKEQAITATRMRRNSTNSGSSYLGHCSSNLEANTKGRPRSRTFILDLLGRRARYDEGEVGDTMRDFIAGKLTFVFLGYDPGCVDGAEYPLLSVLCVGSSDALQQLNRGSAMMGPTGLFGYFPRTTPSILMFVTSVSAVPKRIGLVIHGDASGTGPTIQKHQLLEEARQFVANQFLNFSLAIQNCDQLDMTYIQGRIDERFSSGYPYFVVLVKADGDSEAATSLNIMAQTNATIEAFKNSVRERVGLGEAVHLRLYRPIAEGRALGAIELRDGRQTIVSATTNQDVAGGLLSGAHVLLAVLGSACGSDYVRRGAFSAYLRNSAEVAFELLARPPPVVPVTTSGGVIRDVTHVEGTLMKDLQRRLLDEGIPIIPPNDVDCGAHEMPKRLGQGLTSTPVNFV